MTRVFTSAIVAAPWWGYTTVSPTSKSMDVYPFSIYQNTTAGMHYSSLSSGRLLGLARLNSDSFRTPIPRVHPCVLGGPVKARLIASVVLAASVVLGTSACNLVAPQATTELYDPS